MLDTCTEQPPNTNNTEPTKDDSVPTTASRDDLAAFFDKKALRELGEIGSDATYAKDPINEQMIRRIIQANTYRRVASMIRVGADIGKLCLA
jgi:hypothetical protein